MTEKKIPVETIPGLDVKDLYRRVLEKLAAAREREHALLCEFERAKGEVQYLCNVLGIAYTEHPDAGQTKGYQNKLWRLRMCMRVLRAAEAPMTVRAIHGELLEIGGQGGAGSYRNLFGILTDHPDKFTRHRGGLWILNPLLRELEVVQNIDELLVSTKPTKKRHKQESESHGIEAANPPGEADGKQGGVEETPQGQDRSQPGGGSPGLFSPPFRPRNMAPHHRA